MKRWSLSTGLWATKRDAGLVSYLGFAVFTVLTLLFIGHQLQASQASPLADTLIQALSDAYLAVSVFVAASLLVIYGVQAGMKTDFSALLSRHRRWHIPLSVALGLLPGCGGAVVVVTQFVDGRLGFGSLVAVLLATMGDACFLLIASEPQTAVVVMVVSAATATLCGWFAEWLHGRDFLRPAVQAHTTKAAKRKPTLQKTPLRIKLWSACLVPGLILGLLAAFQVDADALIAPYAPIALTHWVGCLGALFSVWLGFSHWHRSQGKNTSCLEQPTSLAQVLTKVSQETCFISLWVVAGFVSFEVVMHLTGLDFATAFESLGALIIVAAVVVGLIPSCGPQIIMTSLYIQGAIPLSAQLANALGNDGDALFPALALAPKAALLATLYSALPALMVGYIAYWLGF